MPLPPRLYDRTLNAELERLIYQVKVISQDFDGLTWGLTQNQLHYSPAPGIWSVAECIDHLNVSNERFIPNLEAAVRRGREAGLTSPGPFSYGFVSRWIRGTIEPPVKRRFKAPPEFQPGPRKPLAELSATWARQHEKIIELLHEANGLDLARIKVPSPVAKWIKYGLGMGFWIVTAHDRRHLWQARQLRNSSGFPSS